MSLAQIQRIADQATREAMVAIWKRLGQWLDDSGPILPGHLSAKGFKIRNLGEPSEGGDAVPLRYAEATYGPAAMRAALQTNGAAPLNVNGLSGVLAEPQRMGIRVVSDAASLPDVKTGRPFEVIAWQGRLYYFAPMPTPPGVWTALTAAGSVPAGLHSARPLPVTQQLGQIFWETDRLQLYYVISSGGAKVWKALEGASGPMQGTIDPATADQKPADLGTHDVGFRFFSTDFDREYRWSGSAWADSPGAPGRGFVVYYDVSAHSAFVPQNGWVLCDGTTGVTMSTPTGGVDTFDTRDHTTDNRVIRATAGSTGGTGGTATHTHNIDPPNTTTSGPAGDQTVQSGTGVTVASNAHTHDVNIAAFNSGASGTYPPYVSLRPFIRV